MQMYCESENPYFFVYIFSNTYMLRIIAHNCLKTCMCIPVICMEGSMSQFFFT